MPMDLYKKIELISEQFNWSKSKVMRKTIDNFLFLHSFMIEYMAYEKKPPEIILSVIDEIEAMIHEFKR